MEITAEKISEGNKEVLLKAQSKTLRFILGGSGDICITYYSKDKKGTFFIEKSEPIYPVFEQFYQDVVNANIFEGETAKIKNKKVRKLSQAYLNLVQGEYIIWQSDAAPENQANSLNIIRTIEGINIVMEEKSGDLNKKSVYISTSGSRYAPFNICFNKLFNNLYVKANQSQEEFE